MRTVPLHLCSSVLTVLPRPYATLSAILTFRDRKGTRALQHLTNLRRIWNAHYLCGFHDCKVSNHPVSFDRRVLITVIDKADLYDVSHHMFQQSYRREESYKAASSIDDL